jgi:SOS regulatory protein LexA
MVAPNEVKIRVRSNALELKEFTVAQMRRVTGFNSASIRTELQRMKRQGYLTSEPVKERKGRGAPPHVYKLTTDPGKRLELSHQVEAFYTPPPPPAPPKPTSLHFKAAVKLIDRLAAGQVMEYERGEVLDKARYHLKFARHEEGVGIKRDRETEIIDAYICRERGRLEYLQGDLDEAKSLFSQARAVFKIHNLEEQIDRVDAMLLALKVETMLLALKMDQLTEKSHVASIDRFLKLFRNSSSTNPLALTVRHVLEIVRWEILTLKDAFIRIPLLGRIAAGKPIPIPDSDLSPFGYETIELTRGIVGREENIYALRVRGNSMVDALIHDGDIVVMKHQKEADIGELVAVYLKDQKETTLKRFYLEGGQVRLQPANPTMQPIYVHPANVEIQGKVIAVIRQYS